MRTAATPATDLKTLATELVDRALSAGATDAEAVVFEGDEFYTKVRLGQVETLTESTSRAIGLRVFNGLRTASTSTNDLSEDSLKQLVRGAVELSKITEEDPFAGLPDATEYSTVRNSDHLGIYFDDVYQLPAEERIAMARATEAAAMATDVRIQNSDGGTFSASTSHKAMANSRGFAGEYRKSYCGIGTTPIAQDASGMQRDGWGSGARTLRRLESPEAVGAEAAKRALRRLGARRVPTQRGASMVFSREIARGIIGDIFDAVNGDAIYRKASMFEGMLGEQVASPLVTVVDDGTMMLEDWLGGFGTLPYDGDGLPMRRKVIVDKGILQTYVTNTYTSRKLGTKSTGNASRGLAGAPGIGSGNFYLEAGTQTPREIIADVQTGLYVTEVLGSGVNLVTGDYSQGASGIWIENGVFTGAVEEITIAGNLKDMYKNIVAVGNDLIFRGSAASPCIRIDGMTIAGS
ncbi:TldD/PmbA family protein [Terriglobus roseus]|uniref:PmbA protein n=1 Tax=Terriglobus roseus TaxID=392734 RepID=A0A1H4S379_9BACT|nr:TldD/PmbA family protein [Terriglobus roseus]SEC38685.1 microcin-processing peptidase 1. Unknown type peptidase. MEROPS family U62 [Terriglobus roseus]